MHSVSSITAVLPTLNAGVYVEPMVEALFAQTVERLDILVVDSGSSDGTVEMFKAHGIDVLEILPQTFHHAATRNLAAKRAHGDILVFLTQDAIPRQADTLERLTAPLIRGEAAAAFARHVPRADANPLERYARNHNYPETGRLIDKSCIHALGLRALFFSNACSALSSTAFWDVGGFPEFTIMNEDMLIAAKLLEAGYRTAYVAEAEVTHSHDYSPAQTFRRYFDIGVVLTQARHMLPSSSISGEGLDYVLRLVQSLWKDGHAPWIPLAVVESSAKLAGVTLGKRYRAIPRNWIERLSMHPSFWTSPREPQD